MPDQRSMTVSIAGRSQSLRSSGALVRPFCRLSDFGIRPPATHPSNVPMLTPQYAAASSAESNRGSNSSRSRRVIQAILTRRLAPATLPSMSDETAKTEPPPEVLDLKDLARLLRVNPATLTIHIDDMVKQQGFPTGRRIGRLRRWSTRSVLDWLAWRTHGPETKRKNSQRIDNIIDRHVDQYSPRIRR